MLTFRKPIQIVAVPLGGVIALIALCDDGSIWRYDGGWLPMSAIPQTPLPEEISNEHTPPIGF